MSAYLKGSGLENDPLVIHDAESFRQFWMVESRTSKYAVIVNDIDCTNYPITNPTTKWYGWLDGMGHTVTGITLSGADSDAYGGQIKRLIFDRLTSSAYPFFIYRNSAVYKYGFFEDVIFTLSCNAGRLLGSSNGNSPSERVLKFGNVGNFTYSSEWVDCYTLHGTQVVGVDLRSSTTPYAATNYPALVEKPETWIVDGFSRPTLRKITNPALTQVYGIKGTTRVGNQRKSRRIRAMSPSDMHEIATVISNQDGTYLLNIGYYNDNIFVCCGDDYGLPLAKNKEYVIGEIIHPITVNGYRYVCDKAGNSGGALPSEPWSVEELLTVGTARFKADPVFQPMLAGPIKPRLIDLITGDPV